MLCQEDYAKTARQYRTGNTMTCQQRDANDSSEGVGAITMTTVTLLLLHGVPSCTFNSFLVINHQKGRHDYFEATPQWET